MASQSAFATDGYFANGYGMKSIGMGGAAIAVAQEPFGGAVNPGAMSLPRQRMATRCRVVLAPSRRLAHGLRSRRHRRLRRQRQHQLLHSGVRRQLEVSARSRVRRHGVRQRRDEHRLSGRADFGAERLRLLPSGTRRPVQPAVRQRRSRRRPDAADDRAVRFVAVREGPVGRHHADHRVPALQGRRAAGVRQSVPLDRPGNVTNNGYSDSWGVGRAHRLHGAVHRAVRDRRPSGRARSAWTISTTTRGCSRSRADSTSRRASPSASPSARPTNG